jgi:hypothetical protein
MTIVTRRSAVLGGNFSAHHFPFVAFPPFTVDYFVPSFDISYIKVVRSRRSDFHSEPALHGHVAHFLLVRPGPRIAYHRALGIGEFPPTVERALGIRLVVGGISENRNSRVVSHRSFKFAVTDEKAPPSIHSHFSFSASLPPGPIRNRQSRFPTSLPNAMPSSVETSSSTRPPASPKPC